MGLFSRLFGRQRPGQPGLPKRSATDHDSPYITVERGGVLEVLDRETYEYLYGNDRRPNPSQRDLDHILASIDGVRVLAGGLFRGRSVGAEVIAETSDPTAIAELRATLRIDDKGLFSRCACQGGPTLELLTGASLVATLGLQHGHAIRWDRWKPDANLLDGVQLTTWLSRLGVEPAFLELLFRNAYASPQPAAGRRLDRPRQLVILAGHQRGAGDHAGAVATCDRVLADAPDLPDGYAVRGMSRHALGDHAGAVADFTRAIECGGRQPEILFTRAVSLDQLGREAEALADLDAAITLDPSHVAARNSRGLILGRAGRIADALGDLDEAVRLAPDWWLPRANRAGVHAGRGDLDRAIEDVTSVLRDAAKDRGNVPREQLAALYQMRAELNRRRGNPGRAASGR